MTSKKQLLSGAVVGWIIGKAIILFVGSLIFQYTYNAGLVKMTAENENLKLSEIEYEDALCFLTSIWMICAVGNCKSLQLCGAAAKAQLGHLPPELAAQMT